MNKLIVYYLLYLFSQSFLIFFRFFCFLFIALFFLIFIDQFSPIDYSYLVQKTFFFLAWIGLIIDLVFQLKQKKEIFQKKSFYSFCEKNFSLDFKLYNFIDQHRSPFFSSFLVFKKSSTTKIAEITKIIEKFNSKTFLLLLKKQATILAFLLAVFLLVGWLIPQTYSSIWQNIALFFQEKKYNHQLTYQSQVEINQDTLIRYQGNYELVKLIIYATNELGESTNVTHHFNSNFQITLNKLAKNIVFQLVLQQKKLIKKKKHTIAVVNNPELISTDIRLIDSENQDHYYRDIQYIKIKNLKKIYLKAFYGEQQKISEIKLSLNKNQLLISPKIMGNFFTVEINLVDFPFDFAGNLYWQVKNQYHLWSEKYQIYFDIPKRKKPIITIRYPAEKHTLPQKMNTDLLATLFSESVPQEIALFLNFAGKKYRQDIQIDNHLKKKSAAKSGLAKVKPNHYFIEEQINLEKINLLPGMSINYYLAVKNQEEIWGYSKTNFIYYDTPSETLSKKLKYQQQTSLSLESQNKKSALKSDINKLEIAIAKNNWQQATFQQKKLQNNISKIEDQLQEIKSTLSQQANNVEEQIYYEKLQKIISEIERLDQSLIQMLKRKLTDQNSSQTKNNAETQEVLKKAKQLANEIEYLEKQIEHFKKLEKIKEYYQLANNIYDNAFQIKLELLKKKITFFNNKQNSIDQLYPFQKKAIQIDYFYLAKEYKSNYLTLLNDFKEYQHLLNNIYFAFKEKKSFLKNQNTQMTQLDSFLSHQEKIVNDFAALLNAFISDPLSLIITEIYRQINSLSTLNNWQEIYQKNISLLESTAKLKQNNLLTYLNENKSQTKYFRNQLYIKAIGRMTNMVVFLEHYQNNIEWFDLVQRYYDPANSKNNLQKSLNELKNIFPDWKKEKHNSIHHSYQHNIDPFLAAIKAKNNYLIYQLILLKKTLTKDKHKLQQQQNQSQFLAQQQKSLQDLLKQFSQSQKKGNQTNPQYLQALQKEIVKKIDNYQKTLAQSPSTSKEKKKSNSLNSQKYIAEIKKDLQKLKSALNNKVEQHKIEKISKKFSNNLAKANQQKHAIQQKKNPKNPQENKYQAIKAKKYHSDFKKNNQLEYHLQNKKKNLEEIVDYPEEYRQKINSFLQLSQ